MKMNARGLLVPALAGVVSCCTLSCVGARVYPSWRLDEPQGRLLGCASVDAWVKQSTKTGVGVIVHMRSTQQPRCTVRITWAKLQAAGHFLSAAGGERAARLSTKDELFVYLPFVFDGNAAWNDGRRSATLQVAIRVEDAAEVLSWPLRFDQWDEP